MQLFACIETREQWHPWRGVTHGEQEELDGRRISLGMRGAPTGGCQDSLLWTTVETTCLRNDSYEGTNNSI
jgi:hypothetical protein